jgi:uncharacterized metal-binding protein
MELSVQDGVLNKTSASLKPTVCLITAIVFLTGVFGIWALAPPRARRKDRIGMVFCLWRPFVHETIHRRSANRALFGGLGQLVRLRVLS